ncbi:TonB-dependent receptor [Asticcacaulis machinosus]|uniref:TonB-dependent receptor n=1 Tax=Asticcacaulis machinosus TaxID=2984211 RepID=A0ABT5HGI2_9CAUL|nr:TonB-dependent receptor [Asticcacaulis machinosus]MDC7675351.1 TonB-dependent receptor [Asticcacaulis machinosus]
MSKLNLSLWSGAALSVLAFSLVGGAAHAQDASEAAVQTNDSDVQEVVVRGFRKSMGAARQAKKTANITSETIVAEDMAKFPDLNLAESLQRLPGVAINREGGEGRRVSLRGLGPDFTRVQLNGMEVLGNVDSPMDSRGQTSRDRAFDFNLFASDLFKKVEVRKSFSAEQDEGGMAGTVGLYTAKPFDYATGFKGAVSFQGGTNSATKDFQPRSAAQFSYNWDNKFGALISVAYGKRDTEEQGYNTYGAATIRAPANNVTNLSAADQAKAMNGELIFQRGNRLSVWGSEQERLGITSAFQWRPVENVTLTLDALYGKFTNNRSENHLATRASLGSSSVLGASTPHSGNLVAPAPSLNSIRYDQYNSVNYVDAAHTVFATETRRQEAENTFNQVVLTGQWQVSDQLTIDGHIGKETSDYDLPISDKFYTEAFGGLITEYWGTSDAHNTYKWDTTDANNYRAHEIDFSSTYQTTELENAEINATFVQNDYLTYKGGISYRSFSNSGSQYTNDDVKKTEWEKGTWGTGPDNKVNAYAIVFDKHDDQDWIIVDWDKALKHYGITRSVTLQKPSNYTVKEDTTAAYGQMDWNGDFFGKHMRGNVGVRAYETELTSDGFMSVKPSATLPAVVTAVQVKKNYSGFLPSFNAVLELSDSFQIRTAVSQNLNRPGLSAYAMQGSVSEENGYVKVSAGNPNLDPYTSDEFDLSGEWYFGRVGMLTAGVFHKKIDGFIINRTLNNVSYASTGLPENLVAGVVGTTTVNEYTRPVNLKDAKLTGLELNAQTDFFFLSAPFNNFGAIANMTFVKSETENLIRGQFVEGSLYGMSDVNHNLTIYYETSTWGARISENFRSDYTIDGGSFNSTTYVDAAAFWQITPRIRLTVDGVNLTDEREEQVNSFYNGFGQQGAKRLWNTTTSGKTVFVGVSMTF